MSAHVGCSERDIENDLTEYRIMSFKAFEQPFRRAKRGHETVDDLAHVVELRGLHAMPSQVWRSVRLVPLCRETSSEDLRLGIRRYDHDWTAVALENEPTKSKLFYGSYIPSGMIVGWNEGGEPVASWETRLRSARKKRDGRALKSKGVSIGVLQRMIKRVRDESQMVRMLPLHMAIEGLLLHHVGGPDVAHHYYSKQALRDGLLPRCEYMLSGHGLPDLREALSLFEIHPNQCGVAVFAGDQFASVTVVSHPDDYRVLHKSLIDDVYARFLAWAAVGYPQVPEFHVELGDEPVAHVDALRRRLSEARRAWVDAEMSMADGLIGRSIRRDVLYRMGPFNMERFMTELTECDEANFVGERIVRAETGGVEYMRVCRLTAQQQRRAIVLDALASADWDLVYAAEQQGVTVAMMIHRCVQAGLGFLFRPEVIRAYVRDQDLDALVHRAA